MESDDDDSDPESWNAEAHFTNANYQAKKMVLLLFINRPSCCSDLTNPGLMVLVDFQIVSLNHLESRKP